MKPGKLRVPLTILAGLAIALWAATARGLRPGLPLPLLCRYGSDGCFVTAIILCGIGALTLISSTGFFDIFSYGIGTLWHHISSLWKGYEHVRYYDYKAMRAEHRGKSLPFMLMIGLTFLAVSVLLLFLYYALT